jgi:gamma-glutamyltranspeptidase/glutathione hydrolase
MKNMEFGFSIAMVLIIASNIQICSQDLTWFASGNGGVVAAGPKPSVQAGLEILAKGGNAVDAAVAVIFNLAVSDYGMFCIGGEVPFMSYDVTSGKILVFNGMGGAPSDQNTIDWYYANGIPTEGIKAATVPSAVSTCLTALQIKGTMSFEEVISPTLALLDAGGKTWYSNLAATLRRMIETERVTKGTREQKIKAARDRFYKGDIADELNEFYIRSGGLLRKSDLESHKTYIEKPVKVEYRGITVFKCNTWTQGPVLLQTLKLLERFDLGSMGFLSADYVHVTTEAMKLAFADRDKYYGDPQYVKVPLKKLISDKYAAIRVPLIKMDSASLVIRPGDPVKMIAFVQPGEYWPGEKGTTTCVVVDKWGNVVSATPSANPEYGLCESLGIAHNTRLSSLNTQKGHPNSIAPGKRPRITLTPTIVLKDGKPVLAMSVAGGDMQDQVSLQLLLDFVEFGKMPRDAISAPRFRTYHTEDSFNPSPNPNDRIYKIGALEVNMTDQSIIENLKNRGHIINVYRRTIANPVMVYIDQETGISYGASQFTSSGGKYCGALSLSK